MKFDVLFKDKDDIMIQEMILENIHTYNEPIFNPHTTESSIRRNLMFVFRSPYELNYSKNMPLLNEDILKKCIEQIYE